MEIKKLLKNSLYIIPFFVLLFSVFSFIKGISDNPFHYLAVYDGASIFKFVLTFSMGLIPVFIILGGFSASVMIFKTKEIIISAAILIGLTLFYVLFFLSFFGGELPGWFWQAYIILLATGLVFGFFLRLIYKVNPKLIKFVFLALYVICLLIIGKIITQARSEDLLSCGDIKNDNKKSACYFSVAKKTTDINLCGRTIPWDKYCYEEVLNQNKDKISASLCDAVNIDRHESLKNDCYIKAAVAEKDYFVCERIFQNTDKKICVAAVKKDFSFCEVFSNNYYKEKCKDKLINYNKIK